MSQIPDGNLKRLFAQAPAAGSDGAFVASIALDVARRRAAQRARRVALLALLSIAAMGLALLLAPFAPSVTPVSELGNSLLQLPDQVGAAAATARTLPGALYLGIALAVVVLPLASAAWLSRRS
jgi:hypothetical protein